MTQPNTKVEKSTKTASDRQREFNDRQKAKGYKLLTSVWVPASQVAVIREKVRKIVAEWEQSIKASL